MEFSAQIGRVLLRVALAFGLFGWLSRKIFGQRITAVASVTLQSTIRFRLFPALIVFLLLAVVVLPMVLKDDGTARGLTQILLTYTLGLSVFLLGFSTLWLACGVLARDIEDCTIQTLAVKPVARWQIWLGKWLGVMTLNAILLLFAGLAVYSSVLYRAAKLPAEEKEILQNQILVGRGSVKAPLPEDMQKEFEALLADRLKNPQIAQMNEAMVRREVMAMVRGQNEFVPPLMGKRWQMDFSDFKYLVQDKPMQIRVKFNKGVLSQITSFPVMFQVGPPGDPKMIRIETALSDDTYHEIAVGSNLLDAEGMLNVEFYNRSPIPLMVPLHDGVEILYYEAGFGVNFFRGLMVIFLWLALLSALGLAAASYMSFPVAAFCSLALLVITFSSGIMENVVRDETMAGVNHETGKADRTVMDTVAVPVFKVMLKVIGLVKNFSPIDFLSEGRSMTWPMMGKAFLQIGVLFTGLISCIGIGLFYCRELAAVQQTS